MSPDSRQSISPYNGPMAICSIGPRYLRSFSTWNQIDEILGGRDILFHQVDGSRTLNKYHTTECKELRLEEYRVQIQGAQCISIRYGQQFDNALFKDFCEHFGIQNHYSSPAHPQANGQAELANPSLLKISKTQLEGVKGVQPDELPGVLWAYRTTVRTPTGETPFKLAYGSKAVIPAEVHMANHRVTTYQDMDYEEQLRLNLDLIDKDRYRTKDGKVQKPYGQAV